MTEPIRHPLLTQCGVNHGFGVRGAAPPPGLLRPKQVHGIQVAAPGPAGVLTPAEADAVVSDRGAVPIGVVTADCVPVLLASKPGTAVAAIHAGWRGLADGVVAAGVRAHASRMGRETDAVAVIGPHIGACCYEVDSPVIEALEVRFPNDIERALRPTRPGHALLDLGALVARELAANGVAEKSVGRVAEPCTRCDAERFHSYRRDGPRAGRLVHFIAAAKTQA